MNIHQTGTVCQMLGYGWRPEGEEEDVWSKN